MVEEWLEVVVCCPEKDRWRTCWEWRTREVIRVGGEGVFNGIVRAVVGEYFYGSAKECSHSSNFIVLGVDVSVWKGGGA